ncbi:Rop family plasmid primer RNA-binding protein, partial [Escherichia coli]|nr:Rop family plasmid primer RNA-binding protein [Escherichia coli]
INRSSHWLLYDLYGMVIIYFFNKINIPMPFITTLLLGFEQADICESLHDHADELGVRLEFGNFPTPRELS